MSLLEHGLPASFFTRWRAVAVGLFVGGVVLIGNEIYIKVKTYVTEPTTAPACYGNEHIAGKQTLPAYGLRDRYGHSVDDRQASFNPDQVTLALRVCTPQSCPSQAWKAYRSAMFWYLSSRLQHTSNLYRQYGNDGLARARMIYSEPLDIKVVDGLQKRYAAGVFRLNDFSQNHAAVAILVLKGSDGLRPCSKGETDGGD
jgi:hypothetical protein